MTLIEAYEALAFQVQKVDSSAVAGVREDKLYVNDVDVTDHVKWREVPCEYDGNVYVHQVDWEGRTGAEVDVFNQSKFARQLISCAATEKRQQSFRIQCDEVRYSIGDAVVKAGSKATMNGARLQVDGVDVEYILEIRREDTSNRRYGEPRTGRLYVTVGQFGDRKRFPARKDGTVSADKIAEELITYARGVNYKKAADARQRDAKPVVEELRATLKVGSYGTDGLSLEPSTSADAPVFLKFRFERSVTVERAQEIIAALRSVGLAREDGRLS